MMWDVLLALGAVVLTAVIVWRAVAVLRGAAGVVVHLDGPRGISPEVRERARDD